MKIADPSKLTMPISPGIGLFETSWTVSHSESSWTVGTMMLQFTNAVFKSTWMQTSFDPEPSMQLTLLSGWDLVPAKFLGKRRIMMFLLALAAKITALISLTHDCSFFAFEASELRLSPNACRFLLPVSLLSCLINQSDQVVCVGMMFLDDSELLSYESKSKVGMRLYSFITPLSKSLHTQPVFEFFVCPSPLSPFSVCIQLRC
jgi:hypothetical protein